MKRRIFLIISAILCFIIGIVIYNNYEYFYTRFYIGNRVEGTYSVTVEGKKVEIADFEYTVNGESKYKFNEDGFSTKLGEYGVHKIRFVLENRKLYEITSDECFNNNHVTTVGIDYFNTNWWHIFKLDINLDIVKMNGEWMVKTVVYEDDYPFDGMYIAIDEYELLGEFIQIGP